MPELLPRAGIMGLPNVANANASVVTVSRLHLHLCHLCDLRVEFYSTGLTMADRMYDPRPYDTRYNRRWDDRDRERDHYRGDRHDDARYDGVRYDNRRSRYEERRS